jgi:hypothetical protein
MRAEYWCLAAPLLVMAEEGVSVFDLSGAHKKLTSELPRALLLRSSGSYRHPRDPGDELGVPVVEVHADAVVVGDGPAQLGVEPQLAARDPGGVEPLQHGHLERVEDLPGTEAGSQQYQREASSVPGRASAAYRRTTKSCFSKSSLARFTPSSFSPHDTTAPFSSFGRLACLVQMESLPSKGSTSADRCV